MLLGSENEIKVNIRINEITEFFKYRKGPQLETHVCTIDVNPAGNNKLCDAFDANKKYAIDNHISWIQKDGLLYVYTDGRLLIGIPRPNTLMFVQ